MRVLFVSTSYPRDEADSRGIHVHRLASSLVSMGVDVSVVVPAGRWRGEDYELDGVRVHPVNYWIPRYQGLADGLHGIMPNLRSRPLLILLIPMMLAAMTAATMRRASSVDVVHAHWIIPSGVISAIAGRRYRRVVTTHGGDIELAGRSRLAARITRWAANRSDICLGVSEALTERLVDLGVAEDKCVFQPLGVEIASGSDTAGSLAAHQWGGSEDVLRVLFVGSLIERKQPQLILSAMELLRERGVNTRAAFVGDGPLRSALETSAISAGLDVHFAGDTPPGEVRSWLRNADVLVLPSLSEGRPVVIMEAMAESVPVIATEIPGSVELVNDGHTGFLVPTNSAVGIASALEAIAGDGDTGIQLGASGQAKLVAEGLTVRQVAESHIAIYSALISNRAV